MQYGWKVIAGLAESNGGLLPGLWLISPAGWLLRDHNQLRTLLSAYECLIGCVVCGHYETVQWLCLQQMSVNQATADNDVLMLDADSHSSWRIGVYPCTTYVFWALIMHRPHSMALRVCKRHSQKCMWRNHVLMWLTVICRWCKLSCNWHRFNAASVSKFKRLPGDV